MVKQTAGRDALGNFAPKFAELNDDVLFGEVWSRTAELSLRDRSLVTVVALMAQGLTDSSFAFHLQSAKANGITRSEIAEILTHAAFYAGWPKAWAAFRLAKEVWGDEEPADDSELAAFAATLMFPVGEPNDAYAQYFSGKSWLAPLTAEQVPTANVTFEPGCRNNWHVHNADKGGGQMLMYLFAYHRITPPRFHLVILRREWYMPNPDRNRKISVSYTHLYRMVEGIQPFL